MRQNDLSRLAKEVMDGNCVRFSTQEEAEELRHWWILQHALDHEVPCVVRKLGSGWCVMLEQ
jgi:hypothetical protein